MQSEEIEDNEILYRAIPHTPSHIKRNGEFTSAIFKDSKGVSVDRDGKRSESDVVDTFEKRFPGQGVASVTAHDCRNLTSGDSSPLEPVLIISKPTEDNEYHAEIHKSESEIELTKAQARALKRKAKLVRPPLQIP